MGYDTDFVPHCHIPLPELAETARRSAFNEGLPIEHTRFSVIFNQDRGFAHVTAHNIDGDTIINDRAFPSRCFRFDPEVQPNALQVDRDRGYRNNPWDQGHMVRRRSLQWGDFGEAVQATLESDYWTNIAPQHETLHDHAWGSIEDFMLQAAEAGDRRAAVFQAPVLTPNDPSHTNRDGEEPIRIPAGFWKIMALRHRGELRAAAFLVWQRDFDKPQPETFDPVLEQVRVTTVEYLTGLAFPQIVRDADPLHFSRESPEPSGAAWRVTDTPRTAAAFAGSAPVGKRPNFIRGPQDILL